MQDLEEQFVQNEPFQIQGAYVNNTVSFTTKQVEMDFLTIQLINPIYTPGSQRY